MQMATINTRVAAWQDTKEQIVKRVSQFCLTSYTIHILDQLILRDLLQDSICFHHKSQDVSS